MSYPYLGEIRLVSFSFAPKGWAFCNGQILPMAQNQALFALLGTTYGGNGVQTFALPDFQGRMPVDIGAGLVQGQFGGEMAHVLTQPEMPAHTHVVTAVTNASTTDPNGGYLASPGTSAFTSSPTDGVTMRADALRPAGDSQAHNNMPPYLVLNFVIAVSGIFPSRP